MKYKFYLAIPLLFISAIAFGQDNNKPKIDIVINQVNNTQIANTPVKSQISYQALSQFFQSTVTSGETGGFDFKSTWFGVKKLFNDDSLSSYYLSKTSVFARNFEISVGLHKNQSGSLSVLTAGLKYAIINKRSKSDYNFANNDDFYNAIIKKDEIFHSVDSAMLADFNIRAGEPQTEAQFIVYKAAMKKYNKSQKDSDLPAGFADKMKLVAAGRKDVNVQTYLTDPETFYNNIAKQVDKGWLFTVSANPGYDYNHQRLDSTYIKFELLKGFGTNINKPYNIDVVAQGLSLHDTLRNDKNLARREIIGKVGVSKTFVNDAKNNPVIEFELQLEDDNHLGTVLYAKEENNQMTFNTVLTIHISQQISLPITLKYDLKKPNVVGIFNLSWNLENSKSSSKD